MNAQITKERFLSYLENLGLFRWSITETPSEFEAIISKDTRPDIDNFTNWQIREDGTYWVRLSKKDLLNEKITKGFFNA